MVPQPEHNKRYIVNELANVFKNWLKSHRHYWETEYQLGDVIPDHVGMFGKFLLCRDGISTLRQTGKPTMWHDYVFEMFGTWGSRIQAGQVMAEAADTVYIRHLGKAFDNVYLKNMSTPAVETASSVDVVFNVSPMLVELNKNDLPVTVHRPKIRQEDWDKYCLDLTNVGKLDD